MSIGRCPHQRSPAVFATCDLGGLVFYQIMVLASEGPANEVNTDGRDYVATISRLLLRRRGPDDASLLSPVLTHFPLAGVQYCLC
jgi:hypothetical protein